MLGSLGIGFGVGFGGGGGGIGLVALGFGLAIGFGRGFALTTFFTGGFLTAFFDVRKDLAFFNTFLIINNLRIN